MDLNGISCGGYRPGASYVVFSLYDTTLQDVANLDKTKLTLTVSEDNQIIFDGYEIGNIEKEKNAYTVTFTKSLSDGTKASIEALEDNYHTLSNRIDMSESDIQNSITYSNKAISNMLMRANLTDTEALNVSNLYPEWTVDFEYKQNWIIRHADHLYRIGQDHTSQEQWIPGSDGTTALYSKIEIEEGFEVWKEWDGVSGSYAKDQIVKDSTDNNLYKSKIDSNVWGPPSEQPDYWELYEDA